MFKTVGSKFKLLKIDNVNLLDKALQETIVILQALAKCCKIFRIFSTIGLLNCRPTNIVVKYSTKGVAILY